MREADLSWAGRGSGVWIALTGISLGQEEDIRGPKDLIEVPVPDVSTPWWLYALAGLAIVAMAAGLFLWLGRRKAVEVSADERARRELAVLGREGDLMNADDFAAVVSGVLRTFIENRFGLAAPRRTTEEFMLEIGENEALRSRQESLREFLRACDRAKFGGARLDAGPRGELLSTARAFVDDTNREEAKAA